MHRAGASPATILAGVVTGQPQHVRSGGDNSLDHVDHFRKAQEVHVRRQALGEHDYGEARTSSATTGRGQQHGAASGTGVGTYLYEIWGKLIHAR
jgi:hypothetical protein